MMQGLKRIYNGRIVALDTGRITLPNGYELEAEIVHHPGGAAIVAVDAELRVCLLRQYRFILEGWIWELPAGKIDVGQSRLETARRELAEEAGIVADSWSDLGESISSPGIFTERVGLFLAQSLTAVAAAPEDSEMLEVHWVPLEEAVAWAHDGRLSDAKSVVALCRAATQLLK